MVASASCARNTRWMRLSPSAAVRHRLPAFLKSASLVSERTLLAQRIVLGPGRELDEVLLGAPRGGREAVLHQREQRPARR